MSETGGSAAGQVLTSERRYVPDELKGHAIWTMWDFREKVPLAPWRTGHCFPAKWGRDVPDNERPEREFNDVRTFVDMGPEELHRLYGFPEEYGVPGRVVPTFLLPHDPDKHGFSPRLMYVDFDDVRNPKTGTVTAEAAALIDRLDSYTEVSSSGTGLHALVWANLPDLPGFKRVIVELNGVGHIELYDQSRFFAGTWAHVEGTPLVVNERQDVVDEILSEYVDPSDLEDAVQRKRRDRQKQNQRRDPSPGGTANGGGGSSGRSGYYDVDLTRVAPPSPVEVERPNLIQGAHPDHGKTKEGDKSTNYTVFTRDNCWHCFAHESSGGPLHMAAVMSGELSCKSVTNGFDQLSDVAFLRVCLHARDQLGVNGDIDPPYKALVGVARAFDLSMADPEDGILGQTTYKTAREVYDHLDLASLSEYTE